MKMFSKIGSPLGLKDVPIFENDPKVQLTEILR